MPEHPRRPPRPIVVKLGGSHADSRARLAEWLDLLGQRGGRIVLVPGGGPFADQVRRAQQRLGFGDAAADHMALLAMEQFGHMLADLRPGLRPAGSRTAIRRALRRGEVPVWLPTRGALDRRHLPATWDVTSDSLALWLAGCLGAADLVLIKSAPAPAPPLLARELAARGLIDGAFPALLARGTVAAWWLGPGDGPALARALAGAGDPGTRIAA